MSADEGNKQPSEGQTDVSIVPSLNTEHEGGKEVKAGRNANEDTKNEGGDPVRMSRFQAFMLKHFPDAKAHDRWTLVFTFVIALSTFFYTIFAGWTLHEIHSGGTDTHNLALAAGTQASHTEEIAQAAQDQVDAANEISDAADSFSETASTAVDEFKKAATNATENTKRQIRDAKESFSDDQRAWVGVQDVIPKGDFNETHPWGIAIVFSNSGKTAARHVESSILYKVSPIPLYEPASEDIKHLTFRPAQSVPPQGKYIQMIGSNVGTAQPDSANEVEGVQRLNSTTWLSRTKSCSCTISAF